MLVNISPTHDAAHNQKRVNGIVINPNGDTVVLVNISPTLPASAMKCFGLLVTGLLGIVTGLLGTISIYLFASTDAEGEA